MMLSIGIIQITDKNYNCYSTSDRNDLDESRKIEKDSQVIQRSLRNIYLVIFM